MPYYDYNCKCCGKDFTVHQSIKEEKGASCPDCKIWTVNRLISRTSFVLNGGGWAADNYSKSNK